MSLEQLIQLKVLEAKQVNPPQISNLKAGPGMCLAVQVSTQMLHTASTELIPALPTRPIHATHHLFKDIMGDTSQSYYSAAKIEVLE